jgi:hypothetical protein
VRYRLLPGVWLLLLLPLFILLPSCAANEEAAPASEEESLIAIGLSSPAFRHGDAIPTMYACDGDDISPPLQWSDVPAGAQSLALIVDDPDAPSGTWVHWLLYDILPETRGLPEDVVPAASLPGGGSQGSNSWNRLGYGGPCPPGGNSHRYFFKLYALDTTLDLASGATKDQLLAAMEGHILARGELMGAYAR